MASVNKVILVGRLGKDPELKFTQTGTPVANFSVATDETWKDQSGEKQQRTEWHNIVAWKKLAEICGQYLKKGQQVYIEGKIQTRKWTDKEDNTRYTTEIVVHQMVMLGGKKSEDDDESEEGSSNSRKAAAKKGINKANPTPPGDDDLEITDSDIPF